MSKTTRLQVAIVAGSVILFVLLFIANKKPVKKAGEMHEKAETAQQTTDIKLFADAQIASLPAADKKAFAELEKGANDTTSFNKLADFFSQRKMPAASCWYFEKKAEKGSTPKLWCEAGNRWFYSVGFVRDEKQKPALYQSAMKCYEQALEKQPDYTEAKIQLASCYVEGSPDPMKGISMLKEIERQDSTNIQAQMVLGAFAVKSGQMDKAESRYQKVLKLKPEYLEAYLFLADVYEKEGDKKKTIETLEKYVALTPDKEIKEQIKKYIQQLKTNV